MKRSFANSAALYRKATQLMPGGVNSPVRAFKAVGGSPIFFESAKGSRFRDADGNEMVDFCMSWGPLILGHADEEVVEAVTMAARDGLSFGACHRRESELAELILDGFPEYDMVRFVSSGTEAVMTALRLARGFTGRDIVVKFEGCYHGHYDGLLAKSGSGLLTFGISSSAGVPQQMASTTLVLPLDDEARAGEAFERFGEKIAAVIIEPLPANSGLLPQRPEFLRMLREKTQQIGALLIFDEVITGFRLRYGGWGSFLGIEADMVTLGKIIGGGMPVGALAAKRVMMEKLAPQGSVYQAGTLSGNPISMAAGIATLRKLKDPSLYQKLETLGQAFERELPSPQHCVRVGSLIWLNLAGGPPPRSAAAIPEESVCRFNAIYWKLIENGYYMPPSAYEVLFISSAHSQEEVSGLGRLIGSLSAAA